MATKTVFKDIFIIYNPNSTGDSEGMAKELKAELRGKIKAEIKLIPTKYAGHAEELAYDLARKNKSPLIISSSGDGGYHEVVNGVMKAKNEGYDSVCAVLPAGNANDHASAMQSSSLSELIFKGSINRIDLLKITGNEPEKQIVRYAHSYAGIGLTAVVATELNTKRLNPFNEKLLVLKKLYSYRPFMIEKNGKRIKLDSLIFANINRMAKVLTVSEKNTPTDGKFEVISFPYQKKLELVKKLIKSAVMSLKPASYKKYEFKTVKKTIMQVDGEVLQLPPGTDVKIEAEKQALKTLV